ncbi:hypothetical protein H5U35_02850, partial [Candidatus Aerophobetes bacterium]|nr:hypothetical protein [Candidatus Aerophobetes bacterium]
TEKEYFPSSFSLENGFFFILTAEKKVDVYNLEGEIVNNISLPTHALGVDLRGEKIASLEPFPLKVMLYNLDGSFFFDFTDIFLNQEGKEITIRVNSEKDSLQIGDLLITVEPTYHLLLLYSDNGNGFLDSRDEVICAGHEGIEIRKVSYFKGRKFVLRRLKPEIKR